MARILTVFENKNASGNKWVRWVSRKMKTAKALLCGNLFIGMKDKITMLSSIISNGF